MATFRKVFGWRWRAVGVLEKKLMLPINSKPISGSLELGITVVEVFMGEDR